MAKLNDETAKSLVAPYLAPGEDVKYWAFGIRQPNLIIIVGLVALAVLPGLIAAMLLSKNYLIALTTQNRLLVMRLGGGNAVKEVAEYKVDQLRNDTVKTSTGPIFTHIKIKDPAKPFVAKFHRAYASTNRPNAIAIAEAISPPALARPGA
jgi:hypothetical protein